MDYDNGLNEDNTPWHFPTFKYADEIQIFVASMPDDQIPDK
jgi:hypothetical protein